MWPPLLLSPMITHDLSCIKRKASILIIIDGDYLLFYLLVCLSIIFTVQITLLSIICPNSSSDNANF